MAGVVVEGRDLPPSNPDLARRIALGAAWASKVNVPKSWYLPGPEGYIDYPALEPA